MPFQRQIIVISRLHIKVTLFYCCFKHPNQYNVTKIQMTSIQCRFERQINVTFTFLNIHKITFPVLIKLKIVSITNLLYCVGSRQLFD